MAIVKLEQHGFGAPSPQNSGDSINFNYAFATHFYPEPVS